MTLQIKTLQKFKFPEGIKILNAHGIYNSFLDRMTYHIGLKYARNIDAINPINNHREVSLIVSLTSFPARISSVHLCIATLFRQTMAPDRIVLWLAHEQFQDRKLPPQLERFTQLGLEIRFCEDDLRGHKKYYYMMQEAKNALIVTVDDDILFPEDMIEKLYNTYLEQPDCIICHRARKIRMDSSGVVQPYRKWKVVFRVDLKPSFNYMPSTGAGTMYPPGRIDDRAFDKDAIQQYCLSADDIWMKTMSLLKGTKIKLINCCHQPFTIIEGSQNEALEIENIRGGKNDLCAAMLQELYPEAFLQLQPK